MKYRKSFYEDHCEINFVFYEEDDKLIITKPTKNETLVYQFLSERYGFSESTKGSFLIKPFQEFLYQLHEHTIESSERYGCYKILVFLAHLDRMEITEFMQRLIETRAEAEAGVKGIRKLIRRKDNEYAILFVSGAMLKMDLILSVVRIKAEVKKLVEIVVDLEDEESFRIDFFYWDNSK